uniref:Metastasis associated 1 family member 3 n=1 Tax=Eptatretus burgeri TaxID=7764 RepID=A0A8C4Q708_EPTBU
MGVLWAVRDRSRVAGRVGVRPARRGAGGYPSSPTPPRASGRAEPGTAGMAANMYRVGDYVFFENSSSNPYLVRRIEELNKTPNGNVEAKVVCFFRRRDISSNLIALADKHSNEVEEEMGESRISDMTEKQRHQLKHRELFLSRQLEALPATHIRGKCRVTLLNETECLKSYLEKEDCFFYSLVYDPMQKTLLADKGEIRVGARFQAEIPDRLLEGETDGRDQEKLEVLVWDPLNPLSDRSINQFLVIARSVGTFARALDCSSSVRQPSLHMSAAAASRDITLFHAMHTLHKYGYVLEQAVASLVPQGGPLLCRDEMEEWSASEANLFEEALEKYGKDFSDIRLDFLPWKSLSSVIEYYYMWKTTDRYVQQKRLKAAEAESKLKQVYIPNYNKPNPNQIAPPLGKTSTTNGLTCGAQSGASPTPTPAPNPGRSCEGCFATTSFQWYSWGPPNMQCRLCASCWTYWKKYGGLKLLSRLESERTGGLRHCITEFNVRGHTSRHSQSVHTTPMRSNGSPRCILKTRQSFFLHTTSSTRTARRLCPELLQARIAARRPFLPINSTAIKAECTLRQLSGVKLPLKLKPRERKNLESVVKYLEAHPCPRRSVPKTGPAIVATAPSTKIRSVLTHGSPTILGKRSYEQHNGMDEPFPLHRLSYADWAGSAFSFTEETGLAAETLSDAIPGRVSPWATKTIDSGRPTLLDKWQAIPRQHEAGETRRCVPHKTAPFELDRRTR